MKYIIRKENLLTKQKIIYDREFKNIKDAARVMSNYVEFDMMLMQSQHEENTLHFVTSEEKILVAYKVLLTKDNYAKLRKMMDEVPNTNKSEKDLQNEMQEIINSGEWQKVCTYQVTEEDDNFVLPERKIDNPFVSFIAFEGEVMLAEKVFMTKCNVKYSEDIAELFEFTLNVSKRIQLDNLEPLKIIKEKNVPRYTIRQGNKVLYTTITYDASAMEIII